MIVEYVRYIIPQQRSGEFEAAAVKPLVSEIAEMLHYKVTGRGR